MKVVLIVAISLWGQAGFANGSSVVGSAIVPGMGLDSDQTPYQVAEDVIVHNPNKPMGEFHPLFFVDPEETVVLRFQALTAGDMQELEKQFSPVELKNVGALEGQLEGEPAWIVRSGKGVPVLFRSVTMEKDLTEDVVNRIFVDAALTEF